MLLLFTSVTQLNSTPWGRCTRYLNLITPKVQEVKYHISWKAYAFCVTLVPYLTKQGSKNLSFGCHSSTFLLSGSYKALSYIDKYFSGSQIFQGSTFHELSLEQIKPVILGGNVISKFILKLFQFCNFTMQSSFDNAYVSENYTFLEKILPLQSYT